MFPEIPTERVYDGIFRCAATSKTYKDGILEPINGVNESLPHGQSKWLNFPQKVGEKTGLI